MKHLAKLKTLLRGFRFWKVLAEEQDTIEACGYQEQGQLDLPVYCCQRIVKQAAEHHSSGPRRVKDIEIVSTVIWEQRGDQRVRNRLKGAVGDREKERAGPEINKGRLSRHSGHGSESH